MGQQISASDTGQSDNSFDVTGIYNRSANTFDIVVSNTLNSMTVTSFAASGHVLDRQEPVMGTIPAGDSEGQAPQYYFPHEIPNGTYNLISPEWRNEDDPRYPNTGPVFILIDYTPIVNVYGTTQPVINPDTGELAPTGTQTDGSYGVHADMKGDEKTWGCVATTGENMIQNITTFAKLVEAAISSGGSARLTIQS